MTNWSWPTGAPANDDRSLPVFSVLPNWKNGVTETLAWLTDLMVSEQNVEQRRSIRRFPRRSFEASFMRANENRARLDFFFTGVGRRRCLMPMWQEQFKLAAGRTDGYVTFPAGSLPSREYGLNDLVLVTTGDPAKWFILTVTEYDALTDTIRLQGTEDSGPWPEGSRIIPLRVARIMDATAMNNVADRVGISQIRFQLQDADPRFPADWGYCSPLWQFKPDRKGNVDTAYERNDFVLDFQAGVVDVEEVSPRTAISTTMRFIFFGREQVAKARAFLYNARGRARRFYMPSFTADLKVAEDIQSGVTFDVRPSGFLDSMDVPQEARRIITVVFGDGRPPIYRNIESVVNVPSLSAPFETVAERITVDLDMPPISMSEIDRISFIVPSRFDQDTIELFHHTADMTAVSMAAVFKSSVVEGMPPIECWTTSLPYSVVESEQLQTNATITAGRIYSPLYTAPPEALESAAMFTAGDLRQTLKSYSSPAQDALETTATFTAGTLRAALLAYSNYAPEAINSSAIINGGTMAAVLIRYTVPAEAVQPNATITQGTLT